MLQNLQADLKPNTMLTSKSKLFVSVMAGIKTKTLAEKLKMIVESPRIIRVTPNTPATVRAGCSIFSIGEGKITHAYILTFLSGKGILLIMHTFQPIKVRLTSGEENFLMVT